MTDFSVPGYKTGDLLGSGSTGEVFSVLIEGVGEKEQKEEYVLKRYNSISIDRKFLDANFRRMEAMPAHPNIAGVKQFCMNEPPYYSLTEKAAGKQLGEIESLRESEAWELIQQFADGMGHAHKYGVIHGNLHLGNVFFREVEIEGEKNKTSHALTVGDFGSGMIGDVHHIDLDEKTFFFAPEQLESDGRDWENGAALRWDVYSFGVIAYSLINADLPRGKEYFKERRKALAKSGGRPVPVDAMAYVDAVRDTPEIRWSRKMGVSREKKKYREIVEDCLSLDPAKRPVDLREVRNRFLALKNQFAIEDAEERVAREKMKQKAKLFGARAIAATLGLCFLLAAYFVIDFFRKSSFFKNRVSELDQVVTTQRVHIDTLDRNWANTKSDLKNSREAADAFFSTMAHGDDAGGSGVAKIKKSELKKSRNYYLKTLENVARVEGPCVECGRALHSLAHIEQKLGDDSAAKKYFSEAIVSLKEVLASAPGPEVVHDMHLRLADCYENTSQLLDQSMGSQALLVLQRAVEHFGYALKDNPDDASLVLRQAGTNFRLGRAYDAHQDYKKAIACYSASANLATELLKNSPESKALNELLGKLQFQVAKSLRLDGRVDEAINAHIASMETLEKLRGIHGYSPIQAIQMSESFLELGSLFAGKKDAKPDDLDQLYNEALRLLTPLNKENPKDVHVAVLLCRSLSRLGQLENKAGHWTAGYRLSVRGIETLSKALGDKPENIEGVLELAEARIEHLKFLDSEKVIAKKVAGKGCVTAALAQELLKKNAEIKEPFRSQYHQRLGKIFKSYGDIWKGLGESEHSKRCYTQASESLEYVDPNSQAKL